MSYDLTFGTVDECADSPANGGSAHDGGHPVACRGELELTVSKSGATRLMRCAAHAEQYHDAMDALEARLQRDYPGYDNPHSSPPRWHDPLAAGERWHEDDPWP